jgi:hypothetical protein
LKKIVIPIATALAVAGLALVGAAPANATCVYEHAGFSGTAFCSTGSPNKLTTYMNDRGSAISTSYTVIIYEDINKTGRYAGVSSNISNLTTFNWGLFGAQTWNDRISSWQ